MKYLYVLALFLSFNSCPNLEPKEELILEYKFDNNTDISVTEKQKTTNRKTLKRCTYLHRFASQSRLDLK